MGEVTETFQPRGGVVSTPADESGFDLRKFSRERGLPAEFSARHLAAMAQRVAERAAATGQAPMIEDWRKEALRLPGDVWLHFSPAGDPTGEHNIALKFQRLFLAALTGEDPTNPSRPFPIPDEQPKP